MHTYVCVCVCVFSVKKNMKIHWPVVFVHTENQSGHTKLNGLVLESFIGEEHKFKTHPTTKNGLFLHKNQSVTAMIGSSIV